MNAFMRYRWLAIFFIAFAKISLAIPEIPISKDDQFIIHSALFDSFLPADNILADGSCEHLIEIAKQRSFEKISKAPELLGALILFANINNFHNPLILNFINLLFLKSEQDKGKIGGENLRGLKELIRSFSVTEVFTTVEEILPYERQELLRALIQSPISMLRKIGFYIRLFYIDSVYGGELGSYLSGIKYHGKEVASVMPHFPKAMTHLTYNKKKKIIEGEIDMLVLGSGPAGSVVASEFNKKGYKVLVVEKGSLVVPGAINTTDNFRFMDGGGLRLSESGSIGLLNGSVVGGGATVNIDMSYPPTLPYIKHKIQTWHDEGIIPQDLWSEQEMADAYAWVASVFSPRVVEEEEINENNRLFLEGASALGIPTKLYELNTFAKGQGGHEVHSKKSSFEYLLLPEMMNIDNPLTLLNNCSVTKVLIENDKAVGVECKYFEKDFGIGIINDLYDFRIKDGTTIKIYAKEVIVSAGNLGSSAILLNSNIDNDNIGKGFVCHPFIAMMGLFDHEVLINNGEPSTIFIDHFLPTNENPGAPGYLIESAAGQPSLGAILMPGSPDQIHENMSRLKNAGGIGVIVIDDAHKENRVVVENGKIKVHYHLGDVEREKMIEGVKTAAKILFAAGALEVGFHTYEPILFPSNHFELRTLTPNMDLDEAFADFNVNEGQTLLMAAHMMAGNKIGLDRNTSVVDENYEVYGVKDLYVVDSSIFPNSVGANPMQSIYTIAKVFADRHLNRLAEDL